MSDCKKKWDSKLKPSTGGVIDEQVEITHDDGGKLKGKHLDSGKGMAGECRPDGMSWERPDDGTYPKYSYDGEFKGKNRVEGTYTVTDLVNSAPVVVASGDWEADKTGVGLKG